MTKFLIPALAIAVVVVSFLGTSAVFAQSDTSATNTMNRAGQNIEAREAHRAEMQAHSLSVLDEAVAEGLMTEDQKQTMLAMREEFRATRGSQTPEERQASRDAHRVAMKAWETENGIDLSSVCDGSNAMKQMGFGRMAK
jgi:hypothetical protein